MGSQLATVEVPDDELSRLKRENLELRFQNLWLWQHIEAAKHLADPPPTDGHSRTLVVEYKDRNRETDGDGA